MQTTNHHNLRPAPVASAMSRAALFMMLSLTFVGALPQSAFARSLPEPRDIREPLVITQVSTQGEVGDRIARFTMTVEARSHADEESRTVILPADTAITDWSVARGWFGPKGYIVRGRRGIELVLEDKGRLTAELEFVVPVEQSNRTRSITVPMLQGLVATTEITIPGQDLDIQVSPDMSMEKVERANATTIRLFGGRDRATLTWQPKIAEVVTEPIVFADQTMHASIGYGVMRIDTKIDYSIVQDGVEKLPIRFPANCNLLEITGDNIRRWNVEEADDGSRLLNVELNEKTSGDLSLRLVLEKMLPAQESALAIPAVEPLQVNREKGRIVVSAIRGIQVETLDMDNISYMDVREIDPPPLPAAHQLRLGYRYLNRPFALSLRVGEATARTSVETLSLIRTGMNSLRMNSKLNYTIRDAGVFQFTVGLSPGLELVDVHGENINNWRLDETGRVLTVTLRSQAEGEYQLRLETEFEFREPDAEITEIPTITAKDAEREIGYLALLPEPGTNVEMAEIAGLSQVNVTELPEFLQKMNPALGFRYIRPAYRLTVSLSEIEPEVQAEVRSIYKLGDRALEIQSEIHYSIRRAGVFQLRLAIPRELRRGAIEGADIDDTSYDENKQVLTVNLRSQAQGEYVLRMETVKSVPASPEQIEMPVIRTLDTRKENGYLAVVSETSVRLKPAEEELEGLVSIGMSDLPPAMLRQTGDMALAFRYFSQPWQLALQVEPIEPRVVAEMFNLLTVGDEMLTVSATAQYSISNAGIDRLKVRIPPGAMAVEFDGDDIRHREKTDEDGLWIITLQSPRIDSYTLFVDFQIRLDEAQALIPYPGISTPGVYRETGYLAVTSRPEVELQVADQDVVNLTPVDGREIPAVFTQGLETAPLLLAYRYVSHPYMLRISAIPHGAAEVTVAVVETARFSTSITEEGNMITDLACVLRNTRRQYLDLRLPEGARPWHAFVNNQPVTPLRDGDLTKIPVARGDQDGLGTQEVRVRYSHGRNSLGRSGSLRLESPLVGIDVLRLGWTLSLPRGYRVLRETGSIRRLDSEYAMETQLRQLNPDAEIETTVRERRAVSQLESRQAARNILALEQSESDKAGEYRGALYTGTRPRTAETHAFQSLIVSKDEPAWLQIHYLKGSIDMPLKSLSFILGLVVSAVVWKNARRSAIFRVGMLYGCAILVLALRVLLEGAYYSYLAALTYAFAAAATGLMVWSIVQWLAAHRKNFAPRWRRGNNKENHVNSN